MATYCTIKDSMGIWYSKRVPNEFDKIVKLLCEAIPYLQSYARIDAADYYGIDPSAIQLKSIIHYLVYDKEYDVYEVSWIVRVLKEYVNAYNAL